MVDVGGGCGARCVCRPDLVYEASTVIIYLFAYGMTNEQIKVRVY